MHACARSLSLSLSLSHTKLRRNVGFPPNNSEYLERLADKDYHTHMRQCCQYSAVLSLCRAVRSRVEVLSFRHVMYVSILGCRPADIATSTVDTCTTSYTPNMCNPLQNTQLHLWPSYITFVTGQE